MTAMATHTKPALHNAMWPGLVGKGPDSEPPIDLDTMLRLQQAGAKPRRTVCSVMVRGMTNWRR